MTIRMKTITHDGNFKVIWPEELWNELPEADQELARQMKPEGAAEGEVYRIPSNGRFRFELVTGLMAELVNGNHAELERRRKQERHDKSVSEVVAAIRAEFGMDPLDDEESYE